MPFNLDWATITANGSYNLADGLDTVLVTVATTTNALGQTATVTSDGTPTAPALWVSGISEPVTTALTFDSPVSNFSFEIYDIDQSAGSWDDKLTVLVIPPFLTGCIRRTYAAIFSFIAGVMPPMPMLGRSLL